MFARTTFIALIGASALLTGACGSDDAGSTTSRPRPLRRPPPRADRRTDDDPCQAVVQAGQSSVPTGTGSRRRGPRARRGGPGLGGGQPRAAQELVAQLSTDVRAVGVPEENAQAAEELADLYQQAADILAEKGPEGDLEAVFAEVNALSPQINAAAQTLGVEDCGG